MVVSADHDTGPNHSPAFREMLREAARPARGAIERVAIRRTEDGLGIHNPTRRSIPIILFLAVWLAGWSAGVHFAAGEILRGPIPVVLFLLFWLALWLLGGFLAILVLAWQIGGVERLFVISGVLVTETGIGPFRRQRMFPMSSVKNLRAVDGRRNEAGSLIKTGTVAFDVNGKQTTFGVDLDDAERDAVIAALREEMAKPGADKFTPRFGRD